MIVTMVGGQETTTNLIGNGLLTLLRHPDQLERLRSDPTLLESAVEELLRYESPSQHTARLAPAGAVLGGKEIPEGDAVIAVMGAGNRDPERFPDPDRLDLGRQDNRHLAFGWAAHFCFGAPLARIEGQIAFETLLVEVLRAVPGARRDDPVATQPGLARADRAARPAVGRWCHEPGHDRARPHRSAHSGGDWRAADLPGARAVGGTLTFLHEPAAAARGVGTAVLLCPPFGWEEVVLLPLAARRRRAASAGGPPDGAADAAGYRRRRRRTAGRRSAAPVD